MAHLYPPYLIKVNCHYAYCTKIVKRSNVNVMYLYKDQIDRRRLT